MNAEALLEALAAERQAAERRYDDAASEAQDEAFQEIEALTAAMAVVPACTHTKLHALVGETPITAKLVGSFSPAEQSLAASILRDIALAA
jgi:rubrerythrin